MRIQLASARFAVCISLGALALLYGSAASAEYEVSRIGGIVRFTESVRGISCPSDAVLVGMRFKGGTYVDEIQLKCARPTGATTLGNTFDGPTSLNMLNPAEAFLPGVASQEKTVFCPRNHVMSGIKAQAGDYVDRINSIRCTRYRGTSVEYRNVGVGGTGGSTVRAYCTASSGDAVRRFTVKAGMWLDSMRTFCAAQ